jgi:hypothetical protein
MSVLVMARAVTEFKGSSMKRGSFTRAASTVTTIAATVTLLTALGSVSAVAAAGAGTHSGTSADTSGFWVVSNLNESFTAMAVQAAKTSPATVVPTLRAMVSRVEEGHPVYVPQGSADNIASVRASRAELVQALAALTAKRARVGAVPTAARIPPPKEYPVRGAICAKTAKRAWCNLVLELAASYCDPEGCQQTDKMTVRITVNPAVETSRASFNALYFPDDHSFAGFHFQWWVLCFAVQRECGSANTKSFGGSTHGYFDMKSDGALYHSRVTHAITLWGLFIRNGRYYNDDAKTGTAFCADKPDTYCTY